MKGAESLLALLKAEQKLVSFGIVTKNSYNVIEFASRNESRLAFAQSGFWGLNSAALWTRRSLMNKFTLIRKSVS